MPGNLEMNPEENYNLVELIFDHQTEDQTSLQQVRQDQDCFSVKKLKDVELFWLATINCLYFLIIMP